MGKQVSNYLITKVEESCLQFEQIMWLKDLRSYLAAAPDTQVSIMISFYFAL